MQAHMTVERREIFEFAPADVALDGLFDVAGAVLSLAAALKDRGDSTLNPRAQAKVTAQSTPTHSHSHRW